jgi:hypothetical protein
MLRIKGKALRKESCVTVPGITEVGLEKSRILTISTRSVG